MTDIVKKFWDSYPIHKTDFPELVYTRIADDYWRFIDTKTGQTVGRGYKTKEELVADIPRYAHVFGCDGAGDPEPEEIKELRRENERLKKLETDLRTNLDLLAGLVRVREGGGDEDLVSTVVTNLMRLGIRLKKPA